MNSGGDFPNSWRIGVFLGTIAVVVVVRIIIRSIGG
jgi:hypothetical protein